MNVREALVEILSKGTSVDVVVNTMSDEDIQDLSIALELLQKAKFISPDQQKKSRLKAQRNANIDAMREMREADAEDAEDAHRANIHAAMNDKNHRLHHLTHLPSDMDESERNSSEHEEAATTAIEAHLEREKAAGKQLPVPKPNKSSHLKVIKAENVKFAKNGQWSIEKAIKPGPTLDYSKINAKPDYDKIESEAGSIDYSDKKNIEVKKPWAGASAKRQKAMDSINAKQNRTAIEEIKARQETKKKYGL